MNAWWTRRVPIVFALSLLPLRADVTITEKASAEAGSSRSEGERVTMIKGSRMRIESKQGNSATVVIYDGVAKEEITLNAAKRQASIRKFSQIRDAAEKSVPRENVSASMTPTGRNDAIAGLSCEEQAFTVRVEVFKGGNPTLVLTGRACVATNTPGAQEYAAFASAEGKEGLVPGLNSSNPVLVALARAETAAYELVATRGGFPLRMERDIRFEGGFFASLLNKSSGWRKATVTAVSAEPIPSEDFAIPNGWKTTGR
jgi:hypothetical protein